MHRHGPIDRVERAKQEFGGARLGDARLAQRLQQVAGALAKRPGDSLPELAGSEAALEATYRFLSNTRVSAAAILEPHIKRTEQRCDEHARVLALFDTTELRFGGEREQLGYLTGPGGRGLLAHVGLAVSADGRREPLGVLHLETVVRQGPRKQRARGAGKADSEQVRWNRGVAAIADALPRAICVMDREADVFALIREMDQRDQQFIVRAAQNRSTNEGLLWELLDDMPRVGTRTVEVAERNMRPGSDRSNTRHSPRAARTVTLEIHARRVSIRSPESCGRSRQQRAISLPMNLVQVIEPNPPPGDPAVHWLLLTDLPIDTPQQVDFIVDSYRARWVIEELFKSLKTGCALEKRQLESITSVTNALAVSLPIAWLLLRLRNLSRDEPERSAAGLLSPLMMHCLRALHSQRSSRPLPEEPTCKQVTWAIAGLGGHIRNNGEPGFIVLGRGLADLIQATDLAQSLGIDSDL